jgi:hypothetical protein
MTLRRAGGARAGRCRSAASRFDSGGQRRSAPFPRTRASTQPAMGVAYRPQSTARVVGISGGGFDIADARRSSLRARRRAAARTPRANRGTTPIARNGRCHAVCAVGARRRERAPTRHPERPGIHVVLARCYASSQALWLRSIVGFHQAVRSRFVRLPAKRYPRQVHHWRGPVSGRAWMHVSRKRWCAIKMHRADLRCAFCC